MVAPPSSTANVAAPTPSSATLRLRPCRIAIVPHQVGRDQPDQQQLRANSSL
jgi:hypothetical protein